MKAIISGWRHSLGLLAPQQLIPLSILALRQFWRALRIFLKNAWWLIAIDASIFFTFGPALAKTLAAYTKDTTITVDPLVGLMMFVSSILTFLITSIFFVLIRRRTVMPFKAYLRANLLKYIQLMLTFSLVFLLFLYVILSFGIRTIPHMPWIILIAGKVIQDLTAFFWLDASYRLKHMFVSFEKAVNLVFYHMPFIAFLVLIWLGIDYGITILGTSFFNVESSRLMIDASSLFLTAQKITPQVIAIIFAIKYALLLIKNLWLSFLFAFYHRTKREVFSESFFRHH